jgi:hypothetical protein
VVEEYEAIRIRLERTAPDSDTYTVHATSATGEATGTFTVPVSRLELENIVLRMSRARGAVRGQGSPELELVRRFGGDLFGALFAGTVRDLYRDGSSAAKHDRKGLRLTLALNDAPELMDLPWEYLYDEPSFLSISTWTPVVRYLELPRGRQPIEVTPPLRILGIVSSPSDAVELDAELERNKLESALAGPIELGAVQITWLERATLSALQRELRRADFHVVHYIGHGDYDEVQGDGVLVLEDEQGRARRVNGMHLATMLADETTLRLAVLNACEGARTSTTDPFAGVASSLVQRELPAVVAMQFEITDRAAIVFAGEFYAALADGYAVDAALGEARKAIFASGNDTEWATPVLFMRVSDGRIFDVPKPLDARGTVSTAGGSETSAASVSTMGVSLIWTVLTLGVAALLLVGLIYPWDEVGRSWVDRHFHESVGVLGNVFSALAPLALVIGALAALLLVHVAPGRRLFAGGLLIGFGVVGAAKYGGLVFGQLGNDEVRTDSIVVLALVAVGSALLAVLGTKLTSGGEEHYAAGGMRRLAIGLTIAGAALLLVGCLADYNGETSRSILPGDGWLALDPLAGGLVALGAVFLGRGVGETGAGALVAVGAVGMALWLRFIGVPILIDDALGSAGPAGFAGLLGSACLVAAGVVAGWHRRSEPTLAAVPGRV